MLACSRATAALRRVPRDQVHVSASLRRQLLVALVAGTILFALTLVPYIFGYLSAPPGKVFNGFFFIGDDGNTYLSEIRAGATGAWGWSDPYISRPVGDPVLLYMLYILTGKLAGLIHAPLMAAFHVLRWGGAIALVFAARRLAAAVLPAGRIGTLGVVLALVGSGAGYLLAMVGAGLGRTELAGQPLLPLDLHIPEISGLFSILTFPHFAWAAALMGLAVVELMAVADVSQAPMQPAVRAAVFALLLTFIHPQMLVILALLTVVAAVAFRTEVRRLPWLVLPFVAGAPAFLYFAHILTSDPVVSAFAQQWQQGPYPILPTLFAFGLPLALAIAGIVAGRRTLTPRQLVMVAWAGVVLALLYLPAPVSIQRRLFDGIFLPVGMLASLGVAAIARLGAGRRERRRLSTYLVAACLITSLLLLVTPISMSASRVPDIYLDASEAQAMDWLGSQVAGGTPPAVMCLSGTGLFIPARAGARVYTGNYSQTIDSARKNATAADAIRTGGPALVRLMVAEETTYLFVGPRERDSGVGPIDPSLNLVYDRDGVRLYRL